MGGRKNKGGRNKSFGKQRDGGQRHRDGRGSGNQPYADINRSNELLERFYNTLQILPEEEMKNFWAVLRTELPNSFRFTGSKGHALAVQQRFKDHYIPQLTEVIFNGEKVPAPEPLQWYPEHLAWSMTTPKQVVRKNPSFKAFQRFLVSETTVGNISRQEVVSMIPPLFMDIKPGMTVLDLCAAPGSKSAQLIEMIHGGEEFRVRQVIDKMSATEEEAEEQNGIEASTDTENSDKEAAWSDHGRATGLLVANDVDFRRAQMLVHQVKRLNSPNLIVTTHDATMFPSIKLRTEEGKPRRYLKFDRILADVPCSGDGTCRKNYKIWDDWSPSSGLGLHTSQSRILVRALQMLKVDGRVVYSTCSMNPVENEAVVAAAIDRCGGSSHVEIVDCSAELPELKRRPGLRSWSVMSKQGEIYKSWAEVGCEEGHEGRDEHTRIGQTMFSPTHEQGGESLPLDRTMRIYPHDQNTGGFFIAVLRKKQEIKARPEAAAKRQAPDDDKPEPQAKRTKISASETTPMATRSSQASSQQQEEVFKYLDVNLPALDEITKFYEVSPHFPRTRFMVRNRLGEAVKAIYYTSDLAREILTENEARSMRFLHSGVKMFVKQDAQGEDICRWRIQAEGMPIIEPWLGGKRAVTLLKRETLRKVLIQMFPKVGGGGWRELGEIGERMRDIDMGCCILRIEPSKDVEGFDDRIVLPLWRSRSSINLMLPKEERKEMLLRLFNDETELVNFAHDSTRKYGKAASPASSASSLDNVKEDAVLMRDDASANGVKEEADGEPVAAVLRQEEPAPDSVMQDGFSCPADEAPGK